MEGIAKAKAAGVYKGGKGRLDAGRIRELRDKGMGATSIARSLGCTRQAVYRVLERDLKTSPPKQRVT
jgi:DNA invertase Pin-like site-specific DNA recombinase